MSVATPERPSADDARAAGRVARAAWRDASGNAPRRLAGGIGASLLLHVLVIAMFLVRRGAPPAPQPPVYRVDLVAAPPGPRAIGTVSPAPAPPPEPTPAAPTPEPPPRPETAPSRMPAPKTAKVKPAPPVATPVPPKATKPTKPAATKTPPKPAPKSPTPPAPPTNAAKPAAPGPPGPRAGGGPEGGRGADVANVHVAGLDFPYEGYLQNIVRVVALEFTPPKGSVLHADVAFLIHRDGSVSDVRFVRRSGNYAFDTEAQGAVEAAGSKRAFGPLPNGFNGDVLPVTFSFDPRVIH